MCFVFVFGFVLLFGFRCSVAFSVRLFFAFPVLFLVLFLWFCGSCGSVCFWVSLSSSTTLNDLASFEVLP